MLPKQIYLKMPLIPEIMGLWEMVLKERKENISPRHRSDFFVVL